MSLFSREYAPFHHQEVAANRPGFPAPTMPYLRDVRERTSFFLKILRSSGIRRTGAKGANLDPLLFSSAMEASRRVATFPAF
jgi:hypothetical protein